MLLKPGIDTLTINGGVRESIHHQWVVSVGLDQVHVGDQIEVLDLRKKPPVHAPVLKNAAVMAIALRQIGRLEDEPVVIALEVPVLPGVDIEGAVLVAGFERCGHAAAHHVIEKCLLHILIKRRLATHSKGGLLDLFNDVLIFLTLGLQKIPFGSPICQASKRFVVLGKAHYAGKRNSLGAGDRTAKRS